MGNLGILHLSDIHTKVASKDKIAKLTSLLLQDLNKLQEEYDTSIQLICVTGDIINSGDLAEQEWPIFEDALMKPLLDGLHISKESVFFVPGNHEVKRSKINQVMEEGLYSTLASEDKIDSFIQPGDPFFNMAIERSHYVRDFFSQYSSNPVFDSPLTQAYKIPCNNKTIGIVCVDSSWRSTGIGSAEKTKMIIGRKQITEGYAAIQDTDIKICLMHHPLDWLTDADKRAIEKSIGNYDIVLNGHIHESDSKLYTSFNGRTLFNTCGKFDNTSDIYNGYSFISLNPYSGECKVILRQYLDYPRNCYDKAIALCKEGIFETKIAQSDYKLSVAYDIINSISNNFLEYINSFFVSNVALGKVIHSFDESFIPPEINHQSQYTTEINYEEIKTTSDNSAFSLEDSCAQNNNLVIIGKKESGKTTLLHFYFKYYISNSHSSCRVPIYIDCEKINFSGKKVIIRAIHQFINTYCDKDDSFSQSDIETLLESGLCVILLDNYEKIEARNIEKVSSFLTEFPKNRYIFTETEVINAHAITEIPAKPKCEYTTFYIQPLSKKQIRSVVKKYNPEDDTNITNRVMSCFNNTAFWLSA